MTKNSKTLDRILVYLKLNKESGSPKIIDQILEAIQIKATDDEKLYYESKLKETGMVNSQQMSGGRSILRITDAGIVFINEGGYTKDKFWSTLMDVKELLPFVK